jgi:hypothetical protein
LSLEHLTRCPTGVPVTGLHVPSLPFTLQASHCPLQDELQQKPSRQSPFKHWSPFAHCAPGPSFGTHMPAEQ